MKKILLLLAVSYIPVLLSAQKVNSINTAVGFLAIPPDARGAALGDAGVATSPDVNAQYWNPAKYIFSEATSEVGFTYMPWASKLNNGAFNAYLPAYYKLDENQSVSASFRYFSHGDKIDLTSENNQLLGSHKPHEMAIDVAYSRRLAKHFGASLSFRYIRSSITKDVAGSGDKTGQAVAADLGMFYYKPISIFGENFQLGAGASVKNIGSKISYNKQGSSFFLPMNLTIGGSLGYEFDKTHSILLALDFNKLLVPTPSRNENGTVADPRMTKSVVSAIFSSFSDAPDGLSEEVKEITTSIGVEYRYMNLLALRCGYFTQSKDKGGVSFLSAGVGVSYSRFTFDVAYVIPTYNKFISENELRFTLGVMIK